MHQECLIQGPTLSRSSGQGMALARLIRDHVHSMVHNVSGPFNSASAGQRRQKRLGCAPDHWHWLLIAGCGWVFFSLSRLKCRRQFSQADVDVWAFQRRKHYGFRLRAFVITCAVESSNRASSPHSRSHGNRHSHAGSYLPVMCCPAFVNTCTNVCDVENGLFGQRTSERVMIASVACTVGGRSLCRYIINGMLSTYLLMVLTVSGTGCAGSYVPHSTLAAKRFM